MTPHAELYASVYAREFPAQALLRLRPHLHAGPFAVLAGEPPSQTVCSLNTKARRLGLLPGATRVELETFPAIQTLPRSLAEEAAARSALLQCAQAFTPRVEDRSTPLAFLCVLDIAGTEKLLGPPETLARSLSARLKACGITSSIALSTNLHAALAMARGISPRAGIVSISHRQEAAALAPLPLEVLELPPELEEKFSLWGIRTLGALAALPENDLISRLGQPGQRLRQQARGELQHLFLPLEPSFHLQEQMELDTPVEHLDSLLFVAGVLLEQLLLRASSNLLSLSSLTAILSLEGGATHTRTITPALPTSDRLLWLKLLHLDLEAHPPSAAILRLTLTAEPGSTSRIQLGLFNPLTPDPSSLDVTLARIRAIVGEDCVGTPQLEDTHRPDAFRLQPFTASTPAPSSPGPTRSLSATRRIRPPEPVPVKLHSSRPAEVVFRGTLYSIHHAYGPWLNGGNWWSPDAWAHEQWDILARSTHGTNLHASLLRDLTRNQWQMDALYD